MDSDSWTIDYKNKQYCPKLLKYYDVRIFVYIYVLSSIEHTSLNRQHFYRGARIVVAEDNKTLSSLKRHYIHEEKGTTEHVH